MRMRVEYNQLLNRQWASVAAASTQAAGTAAGGGATVAYGPRARRTSRYAAAASCCSCRPCCCPRVAVSGRGARRRLPPRPEATFGGRAEPQNSVLAQQSNSALHFVRALSQRLSATEKEREEEAAAFNRKL